MPKLYSSHKCWKCKIPVSSKKGVGYCPDHQEVCYGNKDYTHNGWAYKKGSSCDACDDEAERRRKAAAGGK
ncbi:hypothetical protein SCHPADRAFT_947916 [Schizopora paradoxa]|uniref:Uncharacterized protein n=1 Tax=Schizopora paradoxa TaxID=27342 RepID=A0A0H2QXS3_9AGAM|nr:hypothetical protein SCHPADRAFT_947916 [Schizopora paradoxa]